MKLSGSGKNENTQIDITFFSSSAFTLPIVNSIIKSQDKEFVEIVVDQLEGRDLSEIEECIKKNKSYLDGIKIGGIKIITQPDRELRGKIVKNPISKFAHKSEISIFQPEKVSREMGEYSKFINSGNETVGLVASYGQILPEASLTAFDLGVINWHPSLLPKYRGPTPMQTAIVNGDQQSGLTWIDMDKGMDSGDILLQINYEMGCDKMLQQVADEFGALGSETWAIALCIQILSKKYDVIRSHKQHHDQATFTKMLSKDDKVVDPQYISALELKNRVRGLQGFPGTAYESKYFKGLVRLDHVGVVKESVSSDNTHEEFLVTEDRGVYISTREGVLEINKITLLDSGKRIDFKGFEFN